MTTVTRMLRKIVRPTAMRALLAWERIESGISYNPASAKLKADPYEKYRKLRTLDPVHRLRLINAWVLAEYEDVDAVLRDHRRFSREYGEYKSMLNSDPPDHTRLRSLVSKAFTPRAVAELKPRIQQIVDDLLDAVEDRDRFDLIEAFAYPLPVIVIAEMLDVGRRETGEEPHILRARNPPLPRRSPRRPRRPHRFRQPAREVPVHPTAARA